MFFKFFMVDIVVLNPGEETAIRGFFMVLGLLSRLICYDTVCIITQWL